MARLPAAIPPDQAAAADAAQRVRALKLLAEEVVPVDNEPIWAVRTHNTPHHFTFYTREGAEAFIAEGPPGLILQIRDVHGWLDYHLIPDAPPPFQDNTLPPGAGRTVGKPRPPEGQADAAPIPAN